MADQQRSTYQHAPEGPIAQTFFLEDAWTTMTLADSTLWVTTFQCTQALTVASFLIYFAGSMASGTLFRMGLYGVNRDTSMALIARSAGIPGETTSSNPYNPIGFSNVSGYAASWDLQPDNFYGIGVLQVGAAVAPTLYAKQLPSDPPKSPPLYLVPRTIKLTSQADLPATIAVGQTPVKEVPWMGLV